MSKFLTLRQVVRLHDLQIERFGGLPGFRDESLLDSAVQQPETTMFGNFLHPNLPSQAAAYMYHLARNHPFLDGNKRTALDATVTFLRLNGYQWAIPIGEAFALTLEVATGQIEKGALAEKIAEFIGWVEPSSAISLAASDQALWREIDAGVANQVDDPSKVPLVQLISRELKQMMVKHALVKISFLRPSSELSIDINSHILARHLVFDFLSGGALKNFAEAYNFNLDDIVPLSSPNQESIHVFSNSVRSAFKNAGLRKLSMNEENAFIGWTPNEDGVMIFTINGLNLNLEP